MSRGLIGALIAVALVATLAASSLAQVYGGGGDDPNKLRATLTGATEVPGPGDGNGSGNAAVTLKQSAGRVCFNVSFRRIGRPVAGHIHRGRPGVAGAIKVLFFERSSGVSSPVQGCKGNVGRGLIADIREHPGRYYVNLHTAAHPDGAIRGQLRQR
jgi:hypothetical protein